MAARNICRRRSSYVAVAQGPATTLDEAGRAGQEALRRLRAAGAHARRVGLGAIGVEVANAALALGMNVLGYDPQITVQRAWQLSSGVEQGAEPR